MEYYEQCRQARDLPSIPGAVIISCDEKLSFEPMESGSWVGRLKVPEREGILRAIDGQHRLLALHADIDRFGDEPFTVPAIIFDRVPEDHIVQMFVTINAKHTRLNASHLVSLSGRQLYRDEALAAAHDVVRSINDREESPLYGEIKLLGVGKGRVGQAPLAQELKKLFADEAALGGARKSEQFREESKKFFVNYFKQIASIFESAWNGRNVQHQVGNRTARVHPRGAGCDPEDRSASRRSAPTFAPSAGSSRRGAAASARSASRPTAPGSGRDDGRQPDEGTAARAAIPGRRGGLALQNCDSSDKFRSRRARRMRSIEKSGAIWRNSRHGLWNIRPRRQSVYCGISAAVAGGSQVGGNFWAAFLRERRPSSFRRKR